MTKKTPPKRAEADAEEREARIAEIMARAKRLARTPPLETPAPDRPAPAPRERRRKR